MSLSDIEVRELFEAERNDTGLTPEEQARCRELLLARIGLATVTGAAATAALGAKDAAASSARASAGAVGTTVAGKALFGLSVVGLAASIYAVTRAPSSRPMPSAPAVASVTASLVVGDTPPSSPLPPSPLRAPPLPPAPLAASPPADPAAESPASSGRVRAQADTPSAKAQGTAGASSVNPSASETFDADAKLLRSVRSALAAGGAEQALAMLDARRSNPTEGVLGEERAAARVMTLCRLGRVNEALSESRRFLSAHPRSPLAERVRRTCAKTPSDGSQP